MDIILVIVDLSLSSGSDDVRSAMEAVSLVISFFFLIDVLLRVYVEGLVVFQSNFVNLVFCLASHLNNLPNALD